MSEARFLQPPVGGVSRQRFIDMYPDENSCWESLKKFRLDQMPCPKCGNISEWKKYTKSRCRHQCGLEKSPTENTIFYKSRLPLWTSYYALLHFSNFNIGIRTDFIVRHFGLHQSRAIRLVRDMRRQAALLEGASQMGGPGKCVYIDEMLLNVRRSDAGRHYRGRFGLIVFGIRCEDRIQLFILPERTQEWTRRMIEHYVARGSIIVTDAFSGYYWLRYSEWEHKVINHRQEWVNVDGFHHGPIDSIFCQLRRFLRGNVLSHCSETVWEYIREFQYRFNRRWAPERRFLDFIELCPTVNEASILDARRQCDLRDFFLV